MTQSIAVDVAIVGGGLVGAAMALALRDAAVSVALVEARATKPLPPSAVSDDAQWDNRIYAISPGSAQFLQQLQVWQTLPAQRMTRIEAMAIYGDNGYAQLDFSAYEAGVGQLAYIAENRLLQDGLWRALRAAQHVRIFCPAPCAALALEPEAAQLQLEDGTEIKAQLIIAADGAHSWVRQQAGILVGDKDYRQLGVVANFTTSQPHQDTAYQWFHPAGVLAYLPLPGNRISIVWSLQEAQAQELLQLTPEALAERVAQASAMRLGALTLISPVAAFPLHLIQSSELVRARVALIGDAAHQVHPLAGQGVNLGFADAQVLANVLAARGPRDCGDAYLLRRYARARREEILAMQVVTDGLQRLFLAPRPVVGWVRNAGLAATNRLSWLKQQLLKQALGYV
jgi:2-polyprenylphenol 6-hydroxylase